MTLFHRMSNWLQQHTAWPQVVLRISLGIMFAVAASGKIAAGSQWPDRMLGFLNFHADKSYGFYSSFLEVIVIPNKDLFGYLVAYGELFVALSLILGLLTRTGAAIGLFMVVNFLMAKGSPFWMPSANDPVYILALFTLIFSQSGRLLGVDYFVNKFSKALQVKQGTQSIKGKLATASRIGGQ